MGDPNPPHVFIPSEKDKYPDTRDRDDTAPEHYDASDQVSPINSPRWRHPSEGSCVPMLSHQDTLLDGNNIHEKSADNAEAGPSRPRRPSGPSPTWPLTRRPFGSGANDAGDLEAQRDVADDTGSVHGHTNHSNDAATGTTDSTQNRHDERTGPSRGRRLGGGFVFVKGPGIFQSTRKKISKTLRGRSAKCWVLLVAGAVGASLVSGVTPGVLLTRWRQSAPPGVYRNSEVAAIAFKNSKNETVRQVIWQDDTYALMTARQVEGVPGWVVTNISESIIKAGNYITVLPGSPLAAATPDFVNTTELDKFWTDIFYLTPANTLNNIWTWNLPDMNLTEKDTFFHPGTLGSYQAIFPSGIGNGTTLTAYRGNSATTRTFFQGGNRKAYMAASNVTSWSSWCTVELSRPPGNATANVGSNTGPAPPPECSISGGVQNIERGSPLAVTKVAPAKLGDGTEPNDMRLFVDSSDMLQEYIYSGASHSWTKGPNEWFLGPQHTPPDVVATSYALSDGQPLNNVLIAIVYDNGTIGQHYWPVSQPEQYKSASPTNVQGVTALAIADDRAYCIVGDKIKEYRISWSNPGLWTPVGDVPTTVTAS